MTDGRAARATDRKVIEVPRSVTGAVSALALAGALWVGFQPIGAVPPLGQLLDPARGVWSAARTAELPASQSLELDGLSAPVEVRYDDRGVPHIFAATLPDMARALGWVHARDRLFQMELTARKVAGTLSEVAGRQVLAIDRQSRERGLAQAALARWEALPADSPTRRIATAYVEGINQWVRDAGVADWPVEYKLLGATPRIFQAHDVYFLLAEMGQVLAWQSDELQRGAIEAIVGREATEALFPVDAPIQEPIEPVAGRAHPRWTSARFPAPRAPGAQAVARARSFDAAARRVASEGFTRGDAVVGSNNWAVAPERTAAGRALLAGDPHLQLSLPSVWYEAHLVVPGELDVYGVTFPLAPVVPIGFNRDVAWTATNTTADVMDFYRETVDDSLTPRRYRVDGAWRDIDTRTETYRGRGGEVLATDTLYRTHRGPLLRTSEGWLSMRWTVLEPSDEATAFLGAMRATSTEGWYKAMEGYQAPAQNFLVADRQGVIGIRSTGRYPIRPGDGRGDRIFDGSTAASDWAGDWPVSRYPQALRPKQGFLASANQQPLDPAVRPGYLGWDWPTPWRAMRINEILRGDSSMTPESMRRAHTDPRSAMTEPVRSAVRAAMLAAGAGATTDERAAMAFLDAWDARFDVESRGAVLFGEFVAELSRRTWDEFAIPGESRRAATPSSMMLVKLLDDPASAWWDDRSTAATTETRDGILRASLSAAWATMKGRRGDDPSKWRWGDVRQARIQHLLQLPGLGRDSLEMQSGPGTLSPNEGRGMHGASWRFVVELGDSVVAWGTYPGGQSGNPVSSRYADRVEQWRRGELSPLFVPRRAEEVTGERLRSTVRFGVMGGAR